jgi:hypothetical protein
MTLRHPANDPAAAFGAAAQARHVGRRAGFIKKDQERRIEGGLIRFQAARCDEVSALLLGGMHDFFKADALRRRRTVP